MVLNNSVLVFLIIVLYRSKEIEFLDYFLHFQTPHFHQFLFLLNRSKTRGKFA
jgi:hypothetical protein